MIALVALANLRGLRESGRLFAVPTYLFIILCGGLVVVGTVRWLTGGLHAAPLPNIPGQAAHRASRSSSSFCGPSPPAAPP